MKEQAGTLLTQPRVGALNGPPHPEGRRFRFRRGALFAFTCTDQIVDTDLGDSDPCRMVVVASIEVQHLDIWDEAPVGADRPFPALFAPVGGVPAGSFPSRPATSHEHPVTNRNRIASKHRRSESLGR